MEESFSTAPWPLYGLPPSVPCRRFLAGWGRSGTTTNSLELGHLPPDGSLNKQLRVEVRSSPGEDSPEDFARGLWRRAHLAAHNTAHPSGDLNSLRRQMDRVDRDYQAESTIAWESVTLLLDNEPVTCQQARYGNDWVALLERNATFIIISGQDWADHTPELVTIENLEPYIKGSRRVWREGFKTH